MFFRCTGCWRHGEWLLSGRGKTSTTHVFLHSPQRGQLHPLANLILSGIEVLPAVDNVPKCRPNKAEQRTKVPALTASTMV